MQLVDLKPPNCKTYSGEFCTFPFKYDGKTFDRCTKYDHGNLVLPYWCSTEATEDGEYIPGKWSKCKTYDENEKNGCYKEELPEA